MRSFGIVSPQFWTGRTGKEIQACGHEPIILAVYLMTSPHSHMCGLYYVSKQYIVLDTGRPLRAVEKAFLQLSMLPSGAFAMYDDVSQYVWVPEMLRWQVGELKAKDGRIQGIINWYKTLPPIPFVHAFFDRYSHDLPGLPKREIIRDLRGPEGGLEGASKAPKSTPDPVPVLIPDLVSFLFLGEFGWAKFTHEQYDALKEALGSHTDEYVRRFDTWVQEAPEATHHGVKRKNRDPYASIKNWYSRDLKEGRLGNHKANAAAANVGAAQDFVGRKLAQTVRGGVPDVREDAG